MSNKYVVVFAAVVLAVVVFAGIYLNTGMSSTVSSMEFIKSRLRGPGVFMDYDNSIGVESIEDIGWWKTKDAWHVMFGKLELSFTPKQLRDKEVLKLVKAIGLDIRGSLEDGELRFFWYDEELKELVQQ